ncbi:hypothetical protein MP638_002140 [Amoeboaphelidium occidentale]|nr:hypothetical protein MP638_002140 [Amoeboaphelidium occidentale]
MDHFYREWTAEESVLIEENRFNFDHPDALDFELLLNTLQTLQVKSSAKVPNYSFIKRSRLSEWTQLESADVVLVEGSLLLYQKQIRELFDIRVFVEEDSDLRLCKRVLRDSEKYMRKVGDVLTEYCRYVKPSFEEFVLPTKKTADIVVPNAEKNSVAIDMIVQHLLALFSSSQSKQAPIHFKPKTSVPSDMLYSSTLSLEIDGTEPEIRK